MIFPEQVFACYRIAAVFREPCMTSLQDGIHARLACITCRRLENITTNFLQCRFMNPHDFNFLPELSNMYQVSAFWGRVSRVTRTKQLLCHGLIIPLPMMWILLTKPMQKSVTTVCLHCSFARLKNKHIGVLGTNVATIRVAHLSPVSGYSWNFDSFCQFCVEFCKKKWTKIVCTCNLTFGLKRVTNLLMIITDKSLQPSLFSNQELGGPGMHGWL